MFELLVLLFIIIVSSVLALVIYFNNPQSATNKSFVLASAAIIFWSIIMYLSVHSSLESTLFYIRLSMLAGTLLAISFLILAIVFPNSEFRIKKWLLVPLLIMMFVTMVVSMSPYMFTELQVENGNIEPVPGPGIITFMITSIGSNIATVFVLIRKMIKSQGAIKNQLQFIVFGTLLMFALLIIANFVAVIIFRTSSFIFLGPLFTLTFLSSVAYAILRHRLFDIRLVVARAVSFALLIVVAAILYTGGFFILGTYFLNLNVSTTQILLSTVIALIIAFSFQPIWKMIEVVTDKFLYKDHYDTKKVLYDSALTMASVLRLEDLCNSLLSLLLSKLKIYNGIFLLVDKGSIYETVSRGYTEKQYLDSLKIKTLLTQQKLVVFEDLTESDLKEALRSLQLEILVPLHTGGQFLGVMGLGQKLSGDIYSAEDLKVIEILAPEIAVSIANAKSYEEIRKFNVTLQQEVQRAIRDLQNANTKLKELDHLKDDFVSVASHELRTPMTAIRSYVWMALHKPDIPLSDKLKRYLYRTLVSTERLINLVNDMLNVSRIEAGKIEIDPKPFDIVTLVKDVLEEVKVKADEKLIKLQIMDQNLPQVFADPDKVHQVLLNLIGNALKFTPPDGIVSVGFFTDGNMIEISVKDTGTGISQEDLSKLFHKFSRLDNSYVAMGISGGTGLGLYISKSLIDMMHGKIWARSEGENKGSVFTFSLPIATQELIKESEKFHIKPKGEVKVLEPVTI